MPIGHIPEHRRLAACEELATLIKDLNDSATSLSKKLVQLAHRDQKKLQKGVSSLIRYRAFDRMLCQNEVAAIEARLLGETPAEQTARDSKRLKKEAAREAHWEAIRGGYIEKPERDTYEGSLRCRWIINNLARLTDDQLDQIYTLTEEMRRSEVVDHGTRRARRAKPKRKAKASPFHVIEGGAGHT